jgi:hypothetical protein
MKFFLLFCLSIFIGKDIATDAWKLQKNSNQIQIYNHRYLETNFKEYRAVMQVKTSIQACVNLLKNDTLAKQWITRSKEFKTIQVISPKEWFTYAEIALPFPFQNRDLISHNILVEDTQNNTIKVELYSVPNFLPEKTDKVRMKNSKGFWLFKQISAQETEITYQFFSEPAVPLPLWFVEPFIVNGLHNTLEKMREKLVLKF